MMLLTLHKTIYFIEEIILEMGPKNVQLVMDGSIKDRWALINADFRCIVRL